MAETDVYAYPEPLVVPPIADHRQTFIILHGRGSNATTFGPALLANRISDFQTFRDVFPHAKFVFPTASKRRAKLFKRSMINQWFDNWSLSTPDVRSELQIEGLRETSAFIHDLLVRETGIVGNGNVVLGGLSQGCAASLIALLTWEGGALPAAFGMCGWLPFRKQMEEMAQPYGGGAEVEADQDDIFARPDKVEIGNACLQAVEYLREELELPIQQPGMTFKQISLFLAHGVRDEKVPTELGRDARRCLERMGMQVDWHKYGELGHWYSSEMLGHLVAFLQKTTGWNDEEVKGKESGKDSIQLELRQK